MNYSKPEITSLASASFVIQVSMTKTASKTDNQGTDFQTPAAYVADE